MYTPFVYIVKFQDPQSRFFRYYIGSKYAKGCTPADLWTSYFTSSTSVHKMIKQYGPRSFNARIAKHFSCKEDAVAYEEKLVKRCLRLGFRLKHELLNEAIPNQGIPTTPEAMLRMAKTRRENGSYDGGAAHPRARKLLLISPAGDVHEIHGNLKAKCNELQLSWQSLRRHIDKGPVVLDRTRYKNLTRCGQGFFNAVGWELKNP